MTRPAGTPRWLAFAIGLFVGASLHAAEPAGRSTSTAEPVRISLWTLALRPFFDQYVTARLAEFEAEHPGVRVDWVDVPFDAMDRKLIAAASAGRSPDVINFSDKTFARFESMGAMADLSALLPGDPETRYLPGASRLGRIGGRLLALPWYLTTQTVLANTDLLAAGGLSEQGLPRRWAPLCALARDFYDKTGKYLFSVPLGTESDIPMMLMADGIPPLRPGPDGRLHAALSSPEAAALIGMWVDLFRSGTLPRESVTGGSAHLTQAYQDGRVALINSGPNFLRRVRDVAPGVFRATAVLPPVTGTLGRAHIAVMVLCVSAQSRQPRLSAELAWHLTGGPAQEELCRLVPVLPSTVSSLDSPLFTPPTPDEAAKLNAADAKVAVAKAVSATSLRSAVAFTPSLSSWPELRRIFEDRIKRVLLENADLASSLRQIDAEWDRLLEASGDVNAPADAIPTARLIPEGGAP